MKNRTTTKHFEIFKKEAELWIDKLSLNDWRVDFDHGPIVSEDPSLACCYSNIPGRCATLVLNTVWHNTKTTPRWIKKVAFHEVLELLLTRISYLGGARYLQNEEIPEERHVIIRKLEKLFYGNASPKQKKV